jgi:hypothetical protein
MWNDPSELVVASNGQVYVAPVGTPLPVNPTTALNAAFTGLGFVTEDGVSLSVSPEIQDFGAWQSRQPVRRELTAQEVLASFALEQWNETTVPLAFGGGEVTSPSTGVYRYELPSGNLALDERSLVIDSIDGDRHMRFVIPRGNITDAVETSLQRTELSVLPIAFKALEPLNGGTPMYFLSDDAAAFAVGS